MNSSQAIAISVGLLVWGWTFISFAYLEPRVLTWITFLTWASFYAAGAGTSGLAKGIASGLLGALVSAALISLNTRLDQKYLCLAQILSSLLAVLGWFLCTHGRSAIVQLYSCQFHWCRFVLRCGQPAGSETPDGARLDPHRRIPRPCVAASGQIFTRSKLINSETTSA